MKRFFGFLLVLAVIAGGGYYWWQQNANRIITQQVKRLAQGFFTNPQNLTVSNDPLKLTGWRVARVPTLTLTGNDLALRNGPKLAYAKLVLTDVDVEAKPTFRITHIGKGFYVAKVRDSAVTEYLHTRGGTIAGMKLIPLDTISVQFHADKTANTALLGKASILGKQIPITARGQLVPSSTQGRVDLRILSVKVQKLSLGAKQVKDALGVVNPVVDFSGWPITTDVQSIQAGSGFVTVRGTITGVEDSLLP